MQSGTISILSGLCWVADDNGNPCINKVYSVRSTCLCCAIAIPIISLCMVSYYSFLFGASAPIFPGLLQRRLPPRWITIASINHTTSSGFFFFFVFTSPALLDSPITEYSCSGSSSKKNFFFKKKGKVVYTDRQLQVNWRSQALIGRYARLG